MSLRIITTLSCSKPSAYLLWAFFLAGFLGSSAIDDLCEDDEQPIVTTPQGTARGKTFLTHGNRTVFGFLGLPYAKPPIGELRFSGPVRPDPWDGILDATIESNPCPTWGPTFQVVGDEDCLYHNLYTPQLPTSEDSPLLPVMVELIGGAFVAGNNSPALFGPDLLLDKDVILVVPNGRVGTLGYLSTGDEIAPGNYGLKDIVRVLEWIQENIKYYGGDPNRVTLFGGSSGGVSTHLIALSDLIDGLIHRYISESGNALSSLTFLPREVSANNTIKLGEYFNCSTSTSEVLIDCLRGLNASRFLEFGAVSLFSVWSGYPASVWLPTVEPEIEGALLTDSPANLLAAGKIRDLPWIASTNRDDGSNAFTLPFFENAALFEDFLQHLDVALPILLGYRAKFDDPTDYTNALKAYYFNDLTANRSELLINTTYIFGDATFYYPTYSTVRQQLALAENPVFLGSFEYRGVFSHSYLIMGNSTKYTHLVVHGDEIIYLFDNHANFYGPADAVRTENDWIMVNRMVQLWTSFAADGVPTMVQADDTEIWQPYSSQNNYLRIGDGPDPAFETKYDLHIERMRFWDELTETFASLAKF